MSTLYTDTPEGLIEMAQRQVHAHLLKLKTEGKVSGRGRQSQLEPLLGTPSSGPCCRPAHVA